MKNRILSVKKQGKLNRLFYKIFSYFMLISMLILLTGSILIIFSYKQEMEGFKARLERNQLATIDILNQHTRSIYETGINTLNDVYIKQYLQPYREATVTNRLELHKISSVILNNRNIISSMVDEIFMYCDDKTVFTADGITDFDIYFDKIYKYDELTVDFWKEKLNESEQFTILPPVMALKEYNGTPPRYVVPIISSEYINGYNTIIAANFQTSFIDKTIKDGLIYPETEYVVTDKNNNVLAASDKGFIDIISKENKKVAYNRKRYILTYSPSEYSRWQYYYFTPLNKLSGSYSSTLITVLLIDIIMIGMAILFSFRFSYKLYNPIHNTLRKIQNHIDVRNEGKNNKEYLNELDIKMDALMAKYENMAESIDNMDTSLMLYLLEGRSERIPKFFLKHFMDTYSFTEPYYLLIVVRFNLSDDFDKQLSSKAYNKHKDYEQMILNKVCDINMSNYNVETLEGNYAIIMNLHGKEDKGRIFDRLREIVSEFKEKDESFDIIISTSSISDQPDSIVHLYDEAMTAVTWEQQHGSENIVDATSMKIDYSFHYTLEEESTILKLLENNDEERLKEMVKEIVERNSNQLVSWKNMQHLINALYYTGQRKAVNKNNELFTKVRLISDLDERVNVILDSYHRIIDDAYPLRKGDSIIISAIRKYISEHYSENICLQTIADKLNYSKKYISRLFKTHTGYNLSDYINMYRVQKAKEKMMNMNMSIGDIQESIGIPSRTTFIRVFKKYEGVTPSKFRELELLSILFEEGIEKESDNID